jgi:hypothetical protein
MVTAPDGYIVSEELGFRRIRLIARPPTWFNLVLLAWFVPWTVATTHLWASLFGIVEPMRTEGSLLGTAIGFSFFWSAAFLFIAFINFYVIETRIYSDRMEDRLGLPGLVLATTIEKDRLSKLVVIKHNAYKDELGEQHEDRWELCIVGKTKRELVLLGAFSILTWTPKKERWTIEKAKKPEELEWRSSVIAEWSGKTLQAN